MKKVLFHKYLLLMFLLLQGMSLFAQKEANIWYFGQNAGVNFNTNPPTALTNSEMRTGEGCASIADKNGNLLFYTDGITVWNKNHQIMTNGTGLYGNSSSTQSALVIKYPGLDSMFIIFTTSAFGSTNGVCYSVVNMKLNGQLGAITSKNIKLVNISAEKIAAISHSNQRDIWVAIPAYSTDSIYTFLVTSLGVNLNAVKNRTGSELNGVNVGQMKFSNNALKLAFIDRYNFAVVISDFNNSTGVITNNRTIYGFEESYGLEFSPNSQYLYVSEERSSMLHQCLVPDLSANRSTVCKNIDSNSINRFGQLQLGPDNKIYSVTTGSKYLGVINNPDNYYNNCGYNQNEIFLNGKTNRFGLPNFYQSIFTIDGFYYNNSDCLGDSTIVSIRVDTTIIDSINWYIGDTLTPIVHGSKIKQFKYLSKDTVTKIILAKVYYSTFPVKNFYGSLITKPYPIFHLPADTALCIGDSIKLKATYSGAKYLWQDNTADSTYLVKKSGLYWVEADYKGCVKYDSVEISSRPKPFINLGNETTVCDNAILLLMAPANYQSYLWNDLSTADSLLVSKEGLYSVTVNDSGCIAQDEIKVSYLKTPIINLGNDTSFCEGVPFYLKATNPQTNYLWNNFSTDSVIKITQSGTYWVKAYNACGTSFDTTEINVEACNCYIYVPNVFTPNGNDLNEVFLPVSNCKITNYNLIILNRWGVKIFESNNPNIGWNGKLNEILQSNGVYVYQIQADLIDNFIGTNKKQISLKGNVTLLN